MTTRFALPIQIKPQIGRPRLHPDRRAYKAAKDCERRAAAKEAGNEK